MSFHIASQSVSVPALGLTINFHADAADTSKVLCEIVSSGHVDLDEDGKYDGEPGPAHTLTLCFNRGGQMLYKRITDPEGEGTHEVIAPRPIADVSDPRPAPQVVNTVETISKPVPEEPAHVDGEGEPAEPVHDSEPTDRGTSFNTPPQYDPNWIPERAPGA